MAEALAKPQSTLDKFIFSKRPPPEPLFTSQEIRDRGSIFIASLYHATSPQEAKARVEHVKRVAHSAKPATHEISAWRCMVVKLGRTGLDGLDDFELQSGSKDDGESWAGGKVLQVMENLAIIDAVVIRLRYGGTLLGQARFTHIQTCAEEVCRKFKQNEETRECKSTLETLDDLLGDLRGQYAKLTTQTTPTSTSSPESFLRHSKKQDYSSLEVQKAKRLIRARESAINSVKSLIAKHQT